MEHRQLGGSGLNVPVLALGTTTFGGNDNFSQALGGLGVRVIIGARNEAQLRDNLGALGCALSAEQQQRLDAASALTPTYPYWHQRGFERNPPPVR